jgi:nucleoside-diphosphate-sugar epimerase
MKLGIIGASGFIGSNLQRLFQEDGYHCIGIHRYLQNRKPKGDDIQINFNDLDNIIKKISQLGLTHLINTAGLAHDKKYLDARTKKLYHEVNVQSTLQLAKAAKGANIEKFVHLSSSKVYGNLVSTSCPGEHDVCEKLDIYGYTKLLGEQTISKILTDSCTSYMILRMPLVYGPGVKGNLQTLAKLLANRYPLPLGRITSNKRSLLSIANLYEFLVQHIEYENKTSHVFNIKDSKDLSTSEIIKKISNSNNYRSPQIGINEFFLDRFLGLVAPAYQARLTQDNIISDAKVRQVLGWKPKMSNDEDFVFDLGDV